MARGKKKGNGNKALPTSAATSTTGFDNKTAVRTVEDLLADQRLEKVSPDRETGLAEVEMAKIHLKSAVKLVDDDPPMAYTALYDAVRKSVSAHMRAHGLRPKGHVAGHVKTMEYAEAVLNAPTSQQYIDDLDAILDRLRTTRNRLEYEGGYIGAEQVKAEIGHAQQIVQAIEDSLAADEQDDALNEG